MKRNILEKQKIVASAKRYQSFGQSVRIAKNPDKEINDRFSNRVLSGK